MSIISRTFKKRPRDGFSKSRGRVATPRLEMLETRALLSTYTVTSTSSDQNLAGSLPYAVFQANHVSRGLDYINFNIPGAGVHPIVLNAQLFLSDQVVIDGNSQRGNNGQPLIYIQGAVGNGLPPLPNLFTLTSNPQNPAGATTSSGSTIQGLGMYSFSQNAVSISSTSTGNYVQDNWIGFYSDGLSRPFLTSEGFPSADGVVLESSFNVIRGNTISGVENGINIGSAITTTFSTDYETNSIQGNNIGTDPTGSTTAGYGTLLDGIFLGVGARRNYLGPDNVISGFRSVGIELFHPTVLGNVIYRNQIGTNRSGTATIGNGQLGIRVANGANGNAVGATALGGNLVSGNAQGGIVLGTALDSVGSSNWVQSNIVGLNASQTGIIGNQDFGLTIAFGSRNVIEGNALAGHRFHGLYMTNTESNYVSGNWVGRGAVNDVGYANGGYGVYLGSGASFNFLYSTLYGNDRLGRRYVDPGAVGNDIRGS